MYQGARSVDTCGLHSGALVAVNQKLGSVLRVVNDLARRLRSMIGGRPNTAALNPEDQLQREKISAELDEAFYSARYPDVAGSGVDHFIEFGWKELRDPAPWFSTSFYLESNPDVASSGLNPFYHFLEHGRVEGRLPAPLDALAIERAWEYQAIRDAIDRSFYAEQLRRLGTDPLTIDPALHYLRAGAELGLDPSADFSTTDYQTENPDVVADGVNPYAHYLKEGRREGRQAKSARPPAAIEAQAAVPEPKTDAEKPKSKKSSSGDHDRELAERSFDANYYLTAYSDVAAAGIDPLDHFLTTGWREGRNPNLWFSVSHYLDFYPDVAAAGINPFLHYLMAGKGEGRLPRHDLGFRYDVITALVPLSARVREARAHSPSRKLSDPGVLREALGRAKRLESTGLYLSISHDDFTENFGGVQLVLMRESTAVDAKGFDHLHLFPATALPVVELETADPVLGVLLNRQRIGFFRASDIRRELATCATRITQLPFVIHSLIGHNADAIVAILQAAGCRSGWYWVHDYSSICAGYTLLRNDVEFCGGPALDSVACSVCVYRTLREQQVSAHQGLFEAFDLTVVAPSNAALDVWKSSTAILAPAKVHEHLRLSTASKKAAARPRRTGQPLRIGYLGQPVTHKGWPVFKELAMKFANDERYDFYHIGKHPQGIPAQFHEVVVGPEDLNKMVKAISDLEIDLVLQWSLWPETFCIAAVEAFQAGAGVLTFKDSGNVAVMVKDLGLGSVLSSEDELIDLFESGRAIALAAETAQVNLSAHFSNMTADLIQGHAA